MAKNTHGWVTKNSYHIVNDAMESGLLDFWTELGWHSIAVHGRVTKQYREREREGERRGGSQVHLPRSLTFAVDGPRTQWF